MGKHNPRPGEEVTLETNEGQIKVKATIEDRQYEGTLIIYRDVEGEFEGYEYEPINGPDLADNEDDLQVVLDCWENEE